MAIGLAALSFGFFIAFIHHVVRMLQISDIIRRIADDDDELRGRGRGHAQRASLTAAS